MYKSVIRWNVACPRHKRYNPDINGQGAIVGGCPTCQRLHDLSVVARKFRVDMRDAVDAINADISAYNAKHGKKGKVAA